MLIANINSNLKDQVEFQTQAKAAAHTRGQDSPKSKQPLFMSTETGDRSDGEDNVKTGRKFNTQLFKVTQ